MKNLSLFCLYRLLKRKPGDIYRFNALIRQFYRFDFPQRCSALNLIQPTISLEMHVPRQGPYGFHSFPVVD